MDNFNEYIRQGEPSKTERAITWQTAIGLQKVDNLEVSEYLVDAARKHIEGDINLSDVRNLINSYYEKKGVKENLSREKEADVVCVYGTNNTNTKILCAVPLCHPKYLRGERYTVNFTKDGRAKISVKDIKIIIDFKNQTCSNNSEIHCYGSETWGNNIEVGYFEE